jgi:hypothetical protein
MLHMLLQVLLADSLFLTEEPVFEVPSSYVPLCCLTYVYIIQQN